ncbi:AN1-type zinc finger protein 2A isoform X1 [Sagmatias obliquidens]|uniref:AN1-type zinc finger protein 2A isoform X1 n=1 Tax=Sagmatias obliquidens TaxID=3371155 RepID=UPI000F4422DB|nr:AN1-type zinc finger protein 2A isoform X1 [Lagenorhynchus obliquidens]XP_026981356.1 AN1-type zinc finger protein 2A isoform X1 [Lagenorhynchus obliquidens]XP_026981358.1 AN1-type zinc finger protein 2A isoform X1 [Lagenorhynchus obliquidens]
MEFPDLGKHCSEKTCNQLDFLPLECDACKQDFCKDHFTCAAHKCPFAFKKDVQVPVCPLCNSPIPVKTGEVPDVVVGEHMDGACKHHPGKKKEKVRTESVSALWGLVSPQRKEDFHVPLLKRGLQAERDAAGGLRRVSRQLLHSAQTPSGPRLHPRRPRCQHGGVLGSKGLGTWAVGGFTRGAGRLAGSALQVESRALM